MAHKDWCGEECKTCTIDCWLRKELSCFPDKDCMLENGTCNPDMVCSNAIVDIKPTKQSSCKLVTKRKTAGLSQSQLAKAADVPIKTIQAYETLARDINKCQVRMALRLAKALSCEVEELLEDEL